MSGEVKRVTQFGVFILLGKSTISALAHITQISDKPVTYQQLTEYYTEGTHVKCKILAVDPSMNRVNVGLKARHVLSNGNDDIDVVMNDDQANDNDGSGDEQVNEQDDNGAEHQLVQSNTANMDTAHATTDRDRDELQDNESDSITDTSSHQSTSGQQVNKDNDADDTEDTIAMPLINTTDLNTITAMLINKSSKQVDENSSNESDNEDYVGKNNVGDTVDDMDIEADRIEKQLLHSSADQPQSISDYEKLLVQQPNNSTVYIQYMAHLLQVNELSNARAIAERALSTIHFRESTHKWNIWLAYTNMEICYGTNESVNELIKRAVQYNDPYSVYIELAYMYSLTDKHVQSTIDTYELCVKKFGSEKLDVYMKYGLYLFTHNMLDQARSLLTRALQRVSAKSSHVQLISKFGVYEYKYGSIDRARTMYDSLIVNYPNKLDLWTIYIDQEIRLVKLYTEQSDLKLSHQITVARQLLDRATSLTLSTKKMKYLFKRQLAFENQYGDSAHAETVKHKAKQYVQRKLDS